MNTCKATVRVLVAHRTYIIIYLVLMGIMMFTLSWSQITTASKPVTDTYQPDTVHVAVIDRDNDQGGLADGLRSYLSESGTLVELDDTSESLQQAVASNWVDLIVIIPQGYAQAFLDAAQSGSDMPTVETVTSYTSGAGTIGGMNVNGFLSLTRIALIGEHVHADTSEMASWAASAGFGNDTDWSQLMNDSGTMSSDFIDSLPEGTLADLSMKDMRSAVNRVADMAHDSDVNRSIAVEEMSSGAQDAHAANPVASGFADTMKTALYPLFLTLSVCVSLVSRVFGTGELRRRLMASPVMTTIGLKRTVVLCGFALLICVAYLGGALVLTAAAGSSLTSLPIGGVVLTFISICMYSLMCVACGFMLGEFGASDMAANGFANIFGLLILFASGISFPASMMPDAMVTLATMTPGWWYCTAIDNAFGVGTASSAQWSQWASATGIVLLFILAFACIGLAAGRFHRSKPAAVASSSVEPVEA